MNQNNISINLKKIILAGLSWIAIYPKQLFFASLVPIILMLPFAFELQGILEQITIIEDLPTLTNAPILLLVYLILALVGYNLLAINVYRLVVLGTNNVGKYGLTYPKRFLQFFYTLGVIQLLLTLPVLLTGIPVLAAIVYLVISPMSINLVRLALNKAKTDYQLDFNTRVKLTILQIIIPSMILIALSALLPFGAAGTIGFLLLRFLLNYWEIITLALCYQQINNDAHM